MATALMDAKTTLAAKGTVERRWYMADAKDQVLGRLSTRIAMLLTGKTKAIYTPSVDCGDFVIVVNAGKVRLTGNKLEDKVVFHHTAHPGGGRATSYKRLLADKPERLLYLSVKRMLPKNKLASRQILRLKIYSRDTHPHSAQTPENLKF